jgi:hypothetical protein
MLRRSPSLSGFNRRTRPVATGCSLVEPPAIDRVRRLQAAEHCRLDASGVQTVVDPITGEEEIVEPAAVGG